MSKPTEDEEKDAVDNITNAMLSVDFLSEISDSIFISRSKPVVDFYTAWCKKRSLTWGEKIPLHPGIVLGLMYVAIVYGKERWDNIIPNVGIKKVDETWAINHAEFKCPKEPKPALSYVVKRLRNALAHGNVRFIIPKGLKRDELFNKVKIAFHDEHPNNRADTFDVTLTLSETFKFIKKFQNFIHEHVKKKYGIAADS